MSACSPRLVLRWTVRRHPRATMAAANYATEVDPAYGTASYDPDHDWRRIKDKQVFVPVAPTPAEKPPGHLRVVCVSDTHNRTDGLSVPPGDVLVHAGDFSMTGAADEVAHFNAWLGTLPHPHKVVIAGNHDGTFHKSWYEQREKWRMLLRHPTKHDCDVVRASLTNCTYLEDSGTVIEGIRFYGSPWQPEFFGWAFNAKRGGDIDRHWRKIPANVDVLITHGPPLGRCDLATHNNRTGCLDLVTLHPPQLRHVQTRVRPRFHIFGHIHEGYGTSSDGMTTYINASTCNYHYRPVNPPIVFDIPRPSSA